MNVDAIKADCQKRKDAGATPESILNWLRENGCSKALAIMVFADVFGYDMAKAKREVHFSQAWADTREADEQWHEELERQSRKELGGSEMS